MLVDSGVESEPGPQVLKQVLNLSCYFLKQDKNEPSSNVIVSW